MTLIIIPFLQMDGDIEEAILEVEENHPYIAVSTGDSSIMIHLAVERCFFANS